jgi:lipopolysaccharide biosynthesis regulator YciM
MKNSERNKKALEYQKNGDVDKAIELYEMNVQLKDEAPASYNRLITIYSKRKDVENESRILKAYLNIAQKRANEASERSKDKKMEIVEFIQKRIDKLKK